VPERDLAELAQHEHNGRRLVVNGLTTFALDQGNGPPVVLLHGIPVSSFLYRRVVPLLASRGLRAIALDLPGLGLADRPRDFDYTLEGLTAFLAHAIDALRLPRCHLVVHDIGGPIGCLWAARHPERILSLTVLNAPLNLATWRNPWTVGPFHRRWLGPLALALTGRRMFVESFVRLGVVDRTTVNRAVAESHYELLRRGDGGRAFLDISRGWCDPAGEPLLRSGLASRTYPAQVVWGERDPVLRAEHRAFVETILRPERSLTFSAKHFLQEDLPTELSAAIASFCLEGAA
jgi:haloalkane dehalogenase